MSAPTRIALRRSAGGWFTGLGCGFVLTLTAACGAPSDDPSVRASTAPPEATTGSLNSPALVPTREALHRLSSFEYNATVADVLGTNLEPATASWRGGELQGFDNMAPALSVDETQFERYFAAAKELASEVVDSERLRAQFVGCDLGLAECVRTSIQRAGLRLFRRPLTGDELRVYTQVYARAIERGDTPVTGFELVFQALLSSAQFIYRVELAPSRPEAPVLVGAYDLASRLSYFLWSSAPDDALLQAASDGSLLREAPLRDSVERMLADPRSKRFVKHFAGQWLEARLVLAHAAAPELYNWTPLVARAAGEELVHFFAEFVANDRPWSEFLKADVHFVDEPLSRYYGLPTLAVPFARVENHNDQRAGFLGLAGFLATSSYDRRSSPSKRGSWITSRLLCAEPPRPPPNVPDLEPASTEPVSALNIREALAAHSMDPGCAGCHAAFDPYGLALERFDAIGEYRTTYADGSLVDETATLPASEAQPSAQQIVGLAGVSEAVGADPRFGHCLAQKLLMYGLGRPLESGDQGSLNQVVEQWRAHAEGASVRRLVHDLVQSASFRSRLTEAAQ